MPTTLPTCAKSQVTDLKEVLAVPASILANLIAKVEADTELSSWAEQTHPAKGRFASSVAHHFAFLELLTPIHAG
jgi:hypothetical protein